MAEHQMICSLERKKQWSQNNTNHESLIQWYVMNSSLLTLLAADSPASCPEWVPLCLFSCLPHICWVPTDSSLSNWVGLALHLLPSADRFQGDLDPGNCPFSCRAH
jgi:hypothetical protein